MHELPNRFRKISLTTWVLLVLGLTFFVISVEGSNFSIFEFFKGIPNIYSFLKSAFPPNLERIIPISFSLLETFQMALVGTLVGVILSLPLAIMSAPSQVHSKFINIVVRGIVGFFRTVPDLIWALIFVISVGLGPFAGTLAIIADTIGFCGRFFAETIEEVDKRPQEALTASGTSKFDKFVCAVLPGALPSFINTSLFALEKATRSSVVLGLVGAGGIGLDLKVAIDLFQFSTASTIIILIFILVIIVEQVSVKVRKKVIG